LASAADQHLRGTVIVRIVDSVTGAPLPDATLAIRGDFDFLDLRQYVRGNSLVDIPYGAYHATVRLRGFAAVRTSITVDACRAWKTIGLTLESPEYKGMLPSISGTVTFGGKPAPLAWVKLIAVYSDTVTEVMADHDGSFSFDGLRDGLYMVNADAADGFVSQTVRLVGGNRSLLLELRPRRSGQY